jgi:hypothetical protein
MSTSKPIHIFKAGTHIAMSGQAMSFSESDLQASASAYDPALHEAPLVVGHPKTDSPAYGWVKGLSFSEVGLQAEPHQVDAEFAELFSAGRFKKVSASFYPPNSPANPVPGVYYLRHVGFLGAQPPSIKGLKQAEFADSVDCVTFEFSEYDDVQNASLWRSVREWIIGKFGLEEADKVVPQYAVQQMEQSAQQELQEAAAEVAGQDTTIPAFHEPNPGGTMSVEDKARLAELEAENIRLKQQQVDFAEQEKRNKAADNHAKNLMFAEGLITAGKLLPAQKDLTVKLLNLIGGQEEVIEFGEGDAKKLLLDAFKTDLLGKLPKQVEFAEVSGADAGIDHAVGDAQHKQKWANDAALRAEFAEDDDYVAFAKAFSLGQIKTVGAK